MLSKSNITGLILAGGAGSRVGHRDKGLISWQGKPLVAHVRESLEPQVGELLISCNRNSARYAQYASRTVADSRLHFQGPLAGLEAAYPYIQTEFVVVVSCDMPRLSPDFVARLIAPFSNGGADSPNISYAHDGIRAQYLCAALRRNCLSSLTRYLDEGHRAVRGWFKCQHSVTVDFSDQRSTFENYNSFQ